jgi:nitrogen regulatory protein PII
MDRELPVKKFMLICAIVNFGAGSRVLKIAKKSGVSGGTIFLGTGTGKNPILAAFDLNDVRKEVVVMVAEEPCGQAAMEAVGREMHMHRANHGVIFAMPLAGVFGVAHNRCRCAPLKKSGGDYMYSAIFTIVDKGKAENVIDAATRAGARGGTIINARGSGIHETQKLFSMNIEPEKEVVLVVAEKELTQAITEAIRADLQIDQPGKGIIFVQEIDSAYGLSQG